MACSTVRYPLLRNSAVRNYAVAAAQAKSCPSGSGNPESQTLSNKVTVAAVDNNSPVAHVSIAFRAGPRNETYETQGISHVLRIAAGLCSTRASYFGITRNIQQLGGNLVVTNDRESISYTLQVTRNNLDHALSFLEDVATRQAFKPWEVSDQSPRLRYQISTVPETSRVIELLHKAAYRKGLGYSLYCPKRNVGIIGSEHLAHFVNNHFTGERCAVVGTGIPLFMLSKLGESLQISSSASSTNEPSKYCGGEIRKERNSELATVAVAVEGVGLDKEREAIALAVLQQAVGTGPKVKWGNSISPLMKAVGSAAGEDPYAASAFNTSYSDSGLFGVVLSAPPNNAGAMTKAAVKFLRSPNLSDADINRGKAELKTAVLYGVESNQGLLENMTQQALLKGKVTSAVTLAAEIDKISSGDVQNAAKKLSSGKLSMGAIGDLRTVPYVDEL